MLCNLWMPFACVSCTGVCRASPASRNAGKHLMASSCTASAVIPACGGKVTGTAMGLHGGVIKSRLGWGEGIDREIMRNEPATSAFFILRLISFLNVYVTSYFCHSRFTHVKTEAQMEWLGSSSVLGLDKGITRPSLKVLEPSRIGREWWLKGNVGATWSQGAVSAGLRAYCHRHPGSCFICQEVGM